MKCLQVYFILRAYIVNIMNNKNLNLILLNMQEEDRQRIARDLHDTSLQNLTHLIHKIELSSLYIDKDPLEAKLELSLVNKELRNTIDEIRGTIFNLRSMTFDDLGLKTAFERLLENINGNHIYQINQDIEDVSCETNIFLSSIYRIGEEALNNIVKHANCSTIWFSCKTQDENYVMDIKDDGVGFDFNQDYVKDKHFGLSLMKQRVILLNGTIEIESSPNKGTEIHIEIPLENLGITV